MLIVGVLIALGLFAILGAVFLMRAPASSPKTAKTTRRVTATTPAIATEAQPPAPAAEPQSITEQPVEDEDETQVMTSQPGSKELELVEDEDETQETTIEISERPSIMMMPKISQGHIVSSTQEDIMELLEEIHHLHKQSARIERRLIYITELIERMEPALIEATSTQQLN